MKPGQDTPAAVNSDVEVAQIAPLPRWRRWLLPRSLKITERPYPLDLPDSGEALMRRLLPSAPAHPSVGSPELQGSSANGLGDKSLAELALQVWRLRKRVERIDPQERMKERRQFEDSAKRLERILADEDIVIDDPVGKPFVDGWVEIEVIAWDPIETDTVRPAFPGPWIKDTVKPIIRRGGKLIGIGQVVAVNP